MASDQGVLSLSCPNRPGIVAAVSTYLFQQACNIREAHQFDDTASGRFFMRLLFNRIEADMPAQEIGASFEQIAERFEMRWTLRPRGARRRVMLLVSRFDHCLVDLLYRQRIGELPMDVTAIVSNHPLPNFAHVDFSGMPFHYLAVSKDTKPEQEARLLELIERTRTELVVLARYMQVLSPELAAKLSGRCINIHHSFLPGFKGARPYQQAFDRGVKLIGATAHYVTADLDEGPIIEQDVERISHQDSVDDLVRKGRDIERRVLARALAWHLDDRVILNGAKTVVFRN